MLYYVYGAAVVGALDPNKLGCACDVSLVAGFYAPNNVAGIAF